MPSESESFLGIHDRAISPLDGRPSGFVTMRRTWIVTLISSYLLSILWLSAFAICVPYVIASAPLGFTSLFWPPADPANARVTLGPGELLLHGIFWTLFVVGLVGCKRLDRRILRGIFTAVVILLVLTMYGCSKYYNFAGLDFSG